MCSFYFIFWMLFDLTTAGAQCTEIKEPEKEKKRKCIWVPLEEPLMGSPGFSDSQGIVISVILDEPMSVAQGSLT